MVLVENVMGTEIWGPAKGCSSVGGDEKLASRSVTWCSGMQVGATTHEEFRVLPCRVKIQGLALIGCAWQWPCWRYYFVSEDFLQGKNLWSMIGRLVLSWWFFFWTRVGVGGAKFSFSSNTVYYTVQCHGEKDFREKKLEDRCQEDELN
jgi:hypothetical protein